MSVIPFRRRAKKPDPEPETPEREPLRCQECGWKMPMIVRVDRTMVRKPVVFYVDCPECGAEELIMIVEFT